MRKTELVKTKAKVIPATQKTIKKIYCDFCNSTLPDHGSYGVKYVCSLCNRDACQKHNSPDPQEFGDYPSWYCDICLPLFIPARSDLEEKQYKEMETLRRKLKKVSLETAINKD